MWHGRTLAVVLPTYNEAGSIAECIRGFDLLGIVDDLVVVNNNAHPDTSPAVASTSAREVHEAVQGYGAAIQPRPARDSTADLVCICEPDGTFDPADLLKLLPFTVDVDVVFGSRTVQTFILHGANMGRSFAGGTGPSPSSPWCCSTRCTCPTSAARSACCRARRSTSSSRTSGATTARSASR